MQSLCIVSLPRSLSTTLYHVARRALGLWEPTWVMDGEILNVDRYWHYHGIRFDESAKFTTSANDAPLFARLLEFLDHTFVPDGYIYKDVTQPFVFAAWLQRNGLPVLKVRRDVTDVAYAMLQRGWFYPSRAAVPAPEMPPLLKFARRFIPHDYSAHVHAFYRRRFRAGLVQGLVRAEFALDAIPGVVVSYNDVVCDESALTRALATLYPQVDVRSLSYLNPKFIRQRDKIAQRRATPGYQRLAAQVEQARAQLNLGSF